MEKETVSEYMERIQSEITAYNNLQDFFFKEHGLVLLNTELDEIVFEVDKFKKTFDEKD